MKNLSLDLQCVEPEILEENSIQGLLPRKNPDAAYWLLLAKVELSSFRKVPKELNKK